MIAVVVCEKFGWTFAEYNEQPKYFIELIVEKIKVDNQREENAMKKK